jgi:hypothetical protein
MNLRCTECGWEGTEDDLADNQSCPTCGGSPLSQPDYPLVPFSVRHAGDVGQEILDQGGSSPGPRTGGRRR